MFFIRSPETDPYFNLALEEHLFERADASGKYLMLWQNENTVVVGVHQNTAQEINAACVREQGIRVVRRLSGGGAVFHDSGNLNYTLIADHKEHEAFRFESFVLPVLDALKRCGVEAEAGGRNDIFVNGKKISGSAQYVRKGLILHHGCIMIGSDLEKVTQALQVNESKYRSKGVPSVRSGITCVNREAPEPVSVELFGRYLTDCIRVRETDFETLTLTEEDLAAVEHLRRTKYETWEWNYGTSPDYDVRKEKKFPAGLVTAYLCVSEGKISDVRFYGDFFGEGDVGELEEAIRGFALDDDLEKRLEKLHVAYYMNGIGAGELARLLTE